MADEEWLQIEPYPPVGERESVSGLRGQFNAVMWRFRTGSPWRDGPECYDSWPTAYGRFCAWAV